MRAWRPECGSWPRPHVVPEEFSLKDQLAAARREYAALTDPEARKAAMARISDLEMRYNMARDARKSFFR